MNLLARFPSGIARISRRFSSIYDISPRVQHALRHGIPVVALESTIITHGMSYPANKDCAIGLERILESMGCVPATIAMIDSRVKIGLDHEQIKHLATSKTAKKVSRRDLALGARTGGLTVSATIVACQHAEIPVFVTGGLGGVHRGSEQTGDVSSDMYELARTNVAVVSAGIKSILDIPKSLQLLETLGVTVVTHTDNPESRNSAFPGFWTRDSGEKSVASLTTDECADMIHRNLQLQLGSGMIIACPIPHKSAMSQIVISNAISKALQKAHELNIHGNAITPFLLKFISDATNGESLASNIDLIENNAKIGGQIAIALAKKTAAKRASCVPSEAFAMIIGGSVIDTSARPYPGHCVALTSAPGSVSFGHGGVGRNMAEAASRLGANIAFHSIVGTDINGKALTAELEMHGVDTSGVQFHERMGTAVYNALLDKEGELVGAVADMDIHDRINPEPILKRIALSRPTVVALDGNFPSHVMQDIIAASKAVDAVVIFEPTSIAKSLRIFESGQHQNVSVVTPDKHEAEHMANFLVQKPFLQKRKVEFDQYPEASEERMVRILLSCFDMVVVKLGPSGVIFGKLERNGDISVILVAPEKVDVVISVTGAGDTLAGAIIACFTAIRNPDVTEFENTLKIAMKAAALTVASPRSVSEKLLPMLLDKYQRV